jgi:hypothetical protein
MSGKFQLNVIISSLRQIFPSYSKIGRVLGRLNINTPIRTYDPTNVPLMAQFRTEIRNI